MKTQTSTLCSDTGCPIGHNKNSLTMGPLGPVLMQDVFLFEKVSQFVRENTPPRKVHALGQGCFGELTITNKELAKYSCAKVFSDVGKKTDIAIRFSGVFLEQGEAETMRDPRGFALKFKTEEGNWDLLAINTPVFNVRDMKLGPDTVHAFKRDPRTFEWNPTTIWDYIVNHPEGLHQVLMVYSDDFGTPSSYRTMDAFGCNTFSFINSNNERFWIKLHLISNQKGPKGLTQKQARLISGEDPNFLSKDLRLAIESGNYPTWRFAFQAMKEEEGYKCPYTFDCTKIWPLKDYPLIDIGEIKINKMPIDYFAEVEQIAFSPANIVPGIGYSPDKLLQGRLITYDNAQYHRLGPNFKQIPINCPIFEPKNNFIGGMHQHRVRNNFPHYYPSIYGGSQPDTSKVFPTNVSMEGKIGYYDLPGEGTDMDYYEQPIMYVNSLTEPKRKNLIKNISISLMKLNDKDLVKKVIKILNKVSSLGDMVEKKMMTTKISFAQQISEYLLKGGDIEKDKTKEKLGEKGWHPLKTEEKKGETGEKV